jgi:hypothetical protein
MNHSRTLLNCAVRSLRLIYTPRCVFLILESDHCRKSVGSVSRKGMRFHLRVMTRTLVKVNNVLLFTLDCKVLCCAQTMGFEAMGLTF